MFSVGLDPTKTYYVIYPSSGNLTREEARAEAARLNGLPPPKPRRGRPARYAEKMIQTGIWFPPEMLAWLKSQPGTISETIRDLIEKEMRING